MLIKIDFFSKLQNSFQSLLFLAHFDKAVPLYIDVNILKERGFSVMTYYSLKIKSEGLSLNESSLNTVITLIIFLSKTLSSTETKYWPTELEMAGLV